MALTKPIAKRRFAASCSSELIEEEIELSFPPSIQVTRVPTGTRYSSDTVQYQSAFVLSNAPDGQRLYVRRSLKMQHKAGTCPAEEANAWKDFHAVLYRDIRSQIFVK